MTLTTDTLGRTEAVRRLLEAWRGEMQARAVYTLLAERQSDTRRAEIIRKIAEGEAVHRERIERRLRELGEPVPDPNSFRISPWLRLQARLAAPERLLASMEVNEQVEIDDRYRKPTGDPETDAVLASIREEEEGHSRQLQTIQATNRAPEPAGGAVQKRLDRILGRETWHRSGSGWISGGIYRANDRPGAGFRISAGRSR